MEKQCKSEKTDVTAQSFIAVLVFCESKISPHQHE